MFSGVLLLPSREISKKDMLGAFTRRRRDWAPAAMASVPRGLGSLFWGILMSPLLPRACIFPVLTRAAKDNFAARSPTAKGAASRLRRRDVPFVSLVPLVVQTCRCSLRPTRHPSAAR